MRKLLILGVLLFFTGSVFAADFVATVILADEKKSEAAEALTPLFWQTIILECNGAILLYDYPVKESGETNAEYFERMVRLNTKIFYKLGKEYLNTEQYKADVNAVEKSTNTVSEDIIE